MSQAIFYFPQFQREEIGQRAEHWLRQYPAGGALVLAAEAELRHIPALQTLFKGIGLPLAGGVAPALITGGGFTSHGFIVALVRQMFPYRIFPLEEPGRDPAELGAAMGRELAGLLGRETGSLFMLFDGMFPRVASVLEAIYLSLADRVRYMGANMGSETFQPMPCVFDQHDFPQGAALFALLPDRGEALLEHGYQAPENAYPATSSQGNSITDINWRPALRVYRELASRQYGVRVDRDNFYQMGVHYPFGIIRMDGEPLVRIPVAIGPDDSLLCVGEIPDNAMLTLLRAVDPEENRTVEHLADRLEDFRPPAVLAFYCAGRLRHLGPAADGELAQLAGRIAPLPLFGALSLGEIGPLQRGSLPLFHNATVVVMPWSN